MKETKEQKKERIRKRNLLDFIILQFRRLTRSDPTFPSLSAPEPEKSRKEREQEEEQQWSMRMQQVRNRVTGQKHAAEERWNRFAGTAESGGRGR